MALETFGFIDDLDPSSPDGATEYVSQGDDHVKGIKLTLKNTFPNITGAVTATQDELNQLAGGDALTYVLSGGVTLLAYTFGGQYISPNTGQVLSVADGHGFIVPRDGMIIRGRSYVRTNSLDETTVFRLYINGVASNSIGSYVAGGTGGSGGSALSIAVSAGDRITILFNTSATSGAISDYNFVLTLR